MSVKETSQVFSAEDLSFSYGSIKVLDGVNLSGSRGEFIALVGSNGSGKSTFLRSLLGLKKPSKGSVKLFGVPPAKLRDRWRIGYVPQRPHLASGIPASVEELVSVGRLAQGKWFRRFSSEDKQIISRVLNDTGLYELRNRPVHELSGGQQQRAFIAKALASDPQFLVLDEPLMGIDAHSQQQFHDVMVHLIKDHGVTILLVSHELASVAEDLDRVALLQGGRIVFDGPPDELAATGVSLGVHSEDLPKWLESQK